MLCVEAARAPRPKGGWRSRLAREMRADFLADNPLCECCEAKGLVVAAEEVHHREAQWRQPALVLVRSNWMSVCRQCHRELTRREFGGKRRVGPDGRLL